MARPQRVLGDATRALQCGLRFGLRFSRLLQVGEVNGKIYQNGRQLWAIRAQRVFLDRKRLPVAGHSIFGFPFVRISIGQFD